MLEFKVNEERCVRCGLCVTDCPTRCIVMEESAFPAIPDESRCLKCQHCLAICPTAAVSILGADPDESMPVNDAFPSPESLEVLIKGRRSIRKYKPQAVDGNTIRELVKTAWHSPTGANTQGVMFTVTMTAEITDVYREEIYQRLTEMFARLDPADDNFSLQYLRRFSEIHDKHGVDAILHGAPHMVIVSAPRTVPLPVEDSIIAMTSFELLAVANGFGTVWNGMLLVCIKKFFPDLGQKLGIPADHEIAFAMAFGHPDVSYERTVQRGPAAMNLVE